MKRDNKIAGPTLPSERIVSLDVLRGFALLGILFANIQISAMIQIAEYNPNAFGDMHGINYVVAMLTNILVSKKFMLLFSMLFGSGIILMAEKIEAKNNNSVKIHFSRMFWLFIIGSIHHYLLAPGEILAYYAIAGVFIFFCRKLSAPRLLIYGLLMVFLCTFFDFTWQYSNNYRSPEEIEKLNKYYWTPDKELINEELARNQGSFADQVIYRVKNRKWFIDQNFYIYTIWIFLGKFLIGMALFKWGIFTARARDKTYRILLLFGMLVGLPVVILGWILNDINNWSMEFSLFIGSWFNLWGGIVLTIGYIGGIMILLKKGRLKRLSRWLAPYGRMALTNFIMQSVICAVLFFGWGFGLSGKVERWGQFLMVIGILIFQMIYSNLWLKFFRFGPVEWLWRSLSYWKIQPFKKIVTK